MLLSPGFHEKNVQSGLDYKPLDGDLFIVTYPKCGTTWMQYITYYIFNSDAPMKNLMEMMFKFCPFLEMFGAEGAKNMTRPGAIKTHLSYDMTPYSERAKYIVVVRNPYDCCVSYYYHIKTFPDYQFENGTFDEFFDMFIRGKVEYGDYFDHLLSWYNHRDDPNVFLVTYEDLKKDTKTWVLKLAKFMGEEYGRKLRDDPGVLENVLEKSSLKAMKGLNEDMKNTGSFFNSVPAEEMTEGLRLFKERIGDVMEKPLTGQFVRKGEVGDWKNHFSKEQIARMKERIALKTKGSDVMNLWKDVDLP